MLIILSMEGSEDQGPSLLFYRDHGFSLFQKCAYCTVICFWNLTLIKINIIIIVIVICYDDDIKMTAI